MNKRLSLLIGASILLHLSSYVSVHLVALMNATKPKEVIEISFVEPTPSPSIESEAANQAKQIVETDEKQANNQINPEARFLSAKNNSVEKETAAPNAAEFKNVKPVPAQAPQIAQEIVPESAPDETLNEKSESKSKLFDTGFDVYSSLNKNEKVKKQMAKEKRQVASTGQTSGTNDHIDEVDDSLMTQLNTREYLYYGYYTRIKNQLNQWWQPKVREKVTKLVSQGRKIATENNKTTKLIIVLDGEGILQRVQVLSESGVRDLDEAAVDAFRQAAPFPNPPSGMIEADGTIKIRWDFVVES